MKTDFLLTIHFKSLDESEDAGRKEVVSACSSSPVCVMVFLGSEQNKTEE